ncbi:MAG: family 78 glycoside hydrolase catalytic domain, partial [Clostridiales bacterium]|nr:family 78 glycoside hydrolase catalytic domain [Clostridiales bacterium]
SYIGSTSPLEIHLNGQKVGDLVLSPKRPVADVEAYYNTYDILPLLQNGENAVGVIVSGVYDFGNRACGMLKIYYKDGSTQEIATGTDWRMTNSTMITRSEWFVGEDRNANFMVGWDTVSYEEDSSWGPAKQLDSIVSDGKLNLPVQESGERRVFSRKTFSGDYTIEAGITITKAPNGNSGNILFGTSSPNPAMWQFVADDSTIRVHNPGNWSWTDGSIQIFQASGIQSHTPLDMKIEVNGTTVNTYIGGELVNSYTVAEGVTAGPVGFRSVPEEPFAVDYVRVIQNGETVFEDNFDFLDTEKWDLSSDTAKLVPGISGTTIIDEVTPVDIYPVGNVSDTPINMSKLSCSDGKLILPTDCGTYFGRQSFSGNYTIEAGLIVTKSLGSVLFGASSPNPAMWQFDAVNGTLRIHRPSDWSAGNIDVIPCSNIKLNSLMNVKIEVNGTTVNTYLEGELVNSSTIAQGAGNGPVGFRAAWEEAFDVDYLRVIQDDETIFEDHFDVLDASKWDFPVQHPVQRYVVDFGKNMSGYVRVNAQSEKGSTVTLKYSEMVNEDGSINAITTKYYPYCTYTFSGGEDSFEPSFFYTGFRYVEVSGIDNPTPDMFTACFVSDDVEQTGYFESSNERLNRVFDLYYRAQRSNMVSNYTDCPQREKNGWTGDASVTKQAASILFGDYTAAEAYMRTMLLNIYDDGMPTCIVPRPVGGDGWRPLYETLFDIPWASAYFTFPYYTYLQTGDKYYIEMMYDGLVRVFAYYRSTADGDGIPTYNKWGDWIGYDYDDGLLDCGALTADYAYYSGLLLSKMAEVIGRDHSDLDAYLETMYHSLQARYNKGDYFSTNTQTANSMALDFDIVPPRSEGYCNQFFGQEYL